MKVAKKYIDKIKESETFFDMAAVCYTILEEEVDNPVVFVSEYLDENTEGYYRNPNFRKLRNFSDSVSGKMENYSEINFSKVKNEIINEMEKLNLETYMDRKKNQLSVVFSILSVIDSLVPCWNVWRIAGESALNKGSSANTCLVYLSAVKKLHGDMALEIGREEKKNGDFGDEFENLLFLRRDRLPKGAESPELYILPYKKTASDHNLKVAIITGITGCHFRVEDSAGSSKIIRYIDKKQRSVAQAMGEKLAKAIQQGAEIVVFPEYCSSPEILNCLKEQLSEIDLKMKASLLAVFTGSTWIESGENEYDNVQYILDIYGREIGTYYKNSPYRKRSKSGKGYESCERLSNPGRRTSLLYVEGIGYILPATCRDAIDGKYTDYLIRKFHPTLLVLPAWSSSGQSFKKPLCAFAADYFTSSVFCNGCGALSRDASIMGGAVMPGKKGTVAAGEFKAVNKPSAEKPCGKECQRFCTYLINFNFDPAYLESKERILIGEL